MPLRTRHKSTSVTHVNIQWTLDHFWMKRSFVSRSHYTTKCNFNHSTKKKTRKKIFVFLLAIHFDRRLSYKEKENHKTTNGYIDRWGIRKGKNKTWWEKKQENSFKKLTKTKCHRVHVCVTRNKWTKRHFFLEKNHERFFVVVVVAHLLELAELLTDPMKNLIPSPLDVISIYPSWWDIRS